MNYSFTQIDMANPETQYWDSSHLNPYAEVNLKYCPAQALAKPAQKRNQLNSGTNGHRLKNEKARLVRINFLLNCPTFTWQKSFFCTELFLTSLNPSWVKLN